MPVDRREWLVQAAKVSGFGVVVGGVAWGRHAKAKSKFRRQLEEHSLPILAGKANRELIQLPARGREEIRVILHGACLRTSAFVDRICSIPFHESLRAASTDDERDRLLALEFERSVLRVSDLCERLELIFGDAGEELDANWEECCRQLAATSGQFSAPEGPFGSSRELMTRIEASIRQQLDHAQRAVGSIGTWPSISETASSVGISVVKLLRVRFVTAGIWIPVFCLTALAPVFRYFAVRLAHSPDEMKSALSSELASLGNRAGNAFESELRRHVATVQQWAVIFEIDRMTEQSFAMPWG